MRLVSQQLESLYNGVSQQPATLRLSSQGEDQVNAYGTVADGLRKRPAFQHLAKVSDTSFDGAFIHNINRDVNERYTVVATDGAIQVFDEDGVEKTVAFPEGTTYLDVGQSDVSQSFAMVTIADYTFVVNKSVQVATKAAPTTPPAQIADGDWFLQPRGDVTEGTVGDSDNALRFYNPAQGFAAGSVNTFEELGEISSPNQGDVYRIAGANGTNFNAYYVIRNGAIWDETYRPNTSTALDELTMPHALVRLSDGTFSLKPFAWDVRKVGSDFTNPPPSFVGRTISDAFYYKNRLGFATDDSVVFSGAGNFGNFWRQTVTDLLDAEVVDISVSSTKVSFLRYAVPFANRLMLFADQTQFSLNVDQLLTPTSASIDAVTDYEMSDKVRPVAIGNDVYFITESGDFSRLREYFVDSEEVNSTDATDVTAHVPKYLPKSITKLTGNANEDVLFALSSEQPNRVYCYKFFWTSEGRVQSAWSYWELPESDVILNIEVRDNELFAIIERDSKVYLEKSDIQSGATTGDLGEQVLLDRLTSITGVYSGGSDTTTFTLPYEVAAANQAGFKIVRGSDFTGEVLSLVDPSTYTWNSTTSITVPGDESAGEVWIGQNYEKRYEFSRQFIESNGRPVTTGRLMMRTFTLYYTDTAFFQTEVAPYGNDPLIEDIVPSQLSEFAGKTLGAASLIVGEPAYHTGSYSFQIYGDSKVCKVALLNDTHVQSVFQSAEWEGLYHNRARAL